MWDIMNTPDVYICGFTKCATTTLYNALSQHSGVYCPEKKEPHYYFAKRLGTNFSGPADQDTIKQMFVTDKGDYLRLYEKGVGKIKVDGSAMYVTDTKIIEDILQDNPDAKFIILLRDPVERAYSSYSHMRRDVREPLSFSEALDEELNGDRSDWLPIWHYASESFYTKRLIELRNIIDEDLLFLATQEEFLLDKEKFLSRVQDFLDLKYERLSVSKDNYSGEPKSRFLQKIIMRKNPVKSFLKYILPSRLGFYLKGLIRKANIGEKKSLSNEKRVELMQFFGSDVRKLSDEFPFLDLKAHWPEFND